MKFIQKILSVLQAEPLVYGLDISDTALRLTYYDGGSWQLKSERLVPGVLEGGRIINRDEFAKALQRLREQLPPKSRRHATNVAVVLSSFHIYSQVFSLPVVRGESMDRAVELNLQMVSPVESSQAYAGWQRVGEDKMTQRIEILCAFINRAAADDINRVLEETGFLIVVLEPRALAVARLLREQAVGVQMDQPYLVASVDDNGLDLLVTRGGQLYFEYFNPWRELHEGRFMAIEMFENIVVRSFSQVLNFSSQHWSEPLKEVFLSATGLGDRVAKVVQSNFQLSIREVELKGPQKIDPSWFAALGAGLRGMVPRRADAELNLMGIEVQEKFRRARLLSFLGFWRILVPVVLTLLVALFLFAQMQLQKIREDTAAIASASQPNEQSQEFTNLEAEAQAFNEQVTLVHSAKALAQPKNPVFDKIMDLAGKYDVAVDQFNFPGCGSPVTFAGKAPSEVQILALKKALLDDQSLSQVTLPLTSIKQDAQGSFSFSVNFSIICNPS